MNRASQSDHWKKDKNLNTIESYLSSPPAIERSKWFAEQLAPYEFDSIFEVGVFAGRNIKYIKESFPSVHTAGLEINPKAVRFAREKVGMGKELLCMDAHDMGSISEKFDIVFTSGVLIHFMPEDVKGMLEKMLKMSNKYVMHIEQLGQGNLTAGPKHMKPSYKVSGQMQWDVNLIDIYKELGYDANVVKLPDSCKTNGAAELIVVKV